MRRSAVLLLASVAAGVADTAEATVEPQLYADTYVVVDGDRIYSVLDIYLKGTHLGDRFGCAVLGLSTHGVIFKTSQATSDGDVFVHGGSVGNGWLPTDSAATSWDSFITAGNRAQGSKARVTNRAGTVIDHGVSVNWTGGSGFTQMSVVESNYIDEGTASGWYSARGGGAYLSAGAAENPFARVTLYNTHWDATYPDLYRGADVLYTKGRMQAGRSTAAGTPVLAGAAGAALDFHMMIGRFAIDITDRGGQTITMQAQFNMVGKNGSGTNYETGTTFTGATNAVYKVSRHFTFAPMLCEWPDCPSDQDDNHEVDGADLALTLLDFGSCSSCTADLDETGLVDTADLALLLLDFGPCEPCSCGPGWCP